MTNTNDLNNINNLNSDNSNSAAIANHTSTLTTNIRMHTE